MNNKSALVITSISAPNSVLTAFAEQSRDHGVDFIVVGDVKSPLEFQLSGCDFWSIERQKTLEFKIAGIIPEGHYARKNLGYLVAMGRGVEVIIETDDDNQPLASFWTERKAWQQSVLLENGSWINVYRYFTDAMIWPRGFPLEYVQRPIPALSEQKEQELFCPIQQGLANANPDVDAIYRLTMPLPQSFSDTSTIVVGNGSWSPFNSQNTTWFKEAFPLLYIPSYCSFRMCDIWRSFVALRICWANDWGVQFHGPTVYQERNEHDLLKDFSDEVPGYLNNARLCQELADLDILKGSDNTTSNMMKCYQAFIKLGLISSKETKLLNAWFSDVSSTH